MYCQVITKRGNPCGNSAKFGKFCGCHSPENIITCSGITKSGAKCKHVIKFGEFCSIHLNCEIKPDNFQLSLYHPDVDWPYMSQVSSRVKKFNNGKSLNDRIDIVINNNRYAEMYFSPIEIKMNQHHTHMILAELIFRNCFLDFNTPFWQEIIISIQLYFKDYPFMDKYREHFRKKFDQQYRVEIQKRYVEKVLTQSDLGKDIAKIITDLI
jgi:hypothetical protein